MARSQGSKEPKAVPAPPQYVCIHGHFYQPPRENPWLETIELQDSAAPYHDWNDRITAECYAPNGASRITNKENQITRIVNNYARMSFNFGPTLLSWLQDNAPRTYRMILDADTASAQRYGGHGSAIAQVYNHVILPLANERDARTQVRWGIADFEHRFGRKPEGMWLPETAANKASLDLLAQEGIRFTILAPHQCARVRATKDAEWTETPSTAVDPRRPYTVQLNDGRSIVVFFYDGPTSRAVAFEGLLNSGEIFGQRILAPLDPAGTNIEPQLAHIATDGESYGHHHKHGEMALSFAMHWIEDSQRDESRKADTRRARLTNYGEFLSKFPPQWEAEIVEDTSWSCSHGVERWRSNCGCGTRQDWNQQWRGPLRNALDQLRDAVTPMAEAYAKNLFKDLWSARDAYIHVILDRITNTDFFAEHATHELSPAERVAALELMELQRHTQLMYTSCGWFFDDISGIETVQVIAYAGRVLQLASKLFGETAANLESQFLETLAQAHSNVGEMETGADVYRRAITPMRIGLEQVGAHYAISSIFRSYPEEGTLFCFDVRRHAHEVFTSGRGRVAIGRAEVRSHITEEAEEICFAVLHLGDQNLSAAVKRFTPEDQPGYDAFSADIRKAIRRADLPEVIRLIDRLFGNTVYSLTSLFADEQHRILRTILDQTLSEMESSLSGIYEDHASLLHFLAESGIAAPPALALAAGFAINAGLRRAFEADEFDSAHIASLLERTRIDQVKLDAATLGFAAGQCMKRTMVPLESAGATDDPPLAALHHALGVAETMRTMPFEVNLWPAQNIWNDLLRHTNGKSKRWPEEWKLELKKLGEAMNIAVDQLVVEEGVSAF